MIKQVLNLSTISVLCLVFVLVAVCMKCILHTDHVLLLLERHNKCILFSDFGKSSEWGKFANSFWRPKSSQLQGHPWLGGLLPLDPAGALPHPHYRLALSAFHISLVPTCAVQNIPSNLRWLITFRIPEHFRLFLPSWTTYIASVSLEYRSCSFAFVRCRIFCIIFVCLILHFCHRLNFRFQLTHIHTIGLFVY